MRARGVVVGALAVVLLLAGCTSPTDAEPTAPSASPSPVATAEPAPTVRPLSERADAAWVARVASTARIPPRAMAAYAGGALAMAEERPGCGIGWNTLAAIGFVEGDHGTYDGNRLDDDGRVRPGIFGIRLDGSASDVIRDSDGGALDGDTEWDRAVGPMQFIPETWSRFGRDGNGDGIRDPQQIDDAVLSAADYLCENGGDLTVPARWIAAVAAYNSHTAYNNKVADAANHYATVR